MYSSEYTSGFSGPAAPHLAAPPLPRYEGNVGQAPSQEIPMRQPKFTERQILSMLKDTDAGRPVNEIWRR